VAGGVGFGPVAPRDRPVDLLPAVQPRVGRVPGHRGVVRVPGGDDPVRAADPQHLAQGRDRIAEVLQDLVGVHDVERAVRGVDGVDVAGAEADRVESGGRGQGAGRVERFGSPVERDHPAGRHSRGHVDADGARPATDVQHVGSGDEAVGEVGGRVGDGAARVRAQHALGVAVRIGLPLGSHPVIVAWVPLRWQPARSDPRHSAAEDPFLLTFSTP
jgi:hypothetical protein